MRSQHVLVFSVIGLLACGGAALPPPELTQARTTYGRTTNGPAAQLAPEQVLAARSALDHAEASFKEHGNNDDTRTLAYVAQRRSEIARSAARAASYERDIRQAARDLAAVEAERLQRGERLPRDTNEALAFTARELERERQAGEEARHHAEEQVDELHRVGHVKREGIGFTVTLSAPENFEDEATTLTDAGASRLDAIAVAIERSAAGAPVTIESHADTANGGDAHDRLLAQKRADVIAAYLATHGVPRQRIKAVGMSPRHFDPASPDALSHGLDRRIEIIVGR